MSPPPPPNPEVARLTEELRRELARQRLATWGGIGSVTDVAQALYDLGWRKT